MSNRTAVGAPVRWAPGVGWNEAWQEHDDNEETRSTADDDGERVNDDGPACDDGRPS